MGRTAMRKFTGENSKPKQLYEASLGDTSRTW